MPLKIIVTLIILIIFANSSANAQQRDVFDWPWGMSCAEIERQYGEGKSSDFDGRTEVISYQFKLLKQILEVRYYCKGRGIFWGDGELTSITIGGNYYDIDKNYILPYCKKVSRFLEGEYGFKPYTIRVTKS